MAVKRYGRPANDGKRFLVFLLGGFAMAIASLVAVALGNQSLVLVVVAGVGFSLVAISPSLYPKR